MRLNGRFSEALRDGSAAASVLGAGAGCQAYGIVCQWAYARVSTVFSGSVSLSAAAQGFVGSRRAASRSLLLSSRKGNRCCTGSAQP